MNKEILNWLLGLKAHVVLIQGHHLRGPKARYYKNKLKKRYHVAFNLATVKNTGTSGGVAILALKGLKVVPVSTLGVEATSPWWAMVVLRCKKLSLLLGTIYLHPELTAINYRTMYEISEAVGKLGLPYLIGGDFNKTPSELETSSWKLLENGQLVTPSNVSTTTNTGFGRLIDYAVVTQSVHSLLEEVEPLYDKPFPTHIGVRYVIKAKPHKVMTRQLVRPKKFEFPVGPRLQCFDSNTCRSIARSQIAKGRRRDHTSIPEYAGRLGVVPKARSLGTKYKEWSASYEVKLLSSLTHHSQTIMKHMGRGQEALLKWQPVVSPHPLEHCMWDPGMRYLQTLHNLVSMYLALYHKEDTSSIIQRQTIVWKVHNSICISHCSKKFLQCTYNRMTYGCLFQISMEGI